MGYKFLVHHENDLVGVAVEDLKPSEKAKGKFLDTNKEIEVKILEDVPLGHKIALKDIRSGETVFEYGEKTGVATKDIKQGEHVHVHNIKSLRWGGISK